MLYIRKWASLFIYFFPAFNFIAWTQRVEESHMKRYGVFKALKGRETLAAGSDPQPK